MSLIFLVMCAKLIYLGTYVDTGASFGGDVCPVFPSHPKCVPSNKSASAGLCSGTNCLVECDFEVFIRI